MRCRDTMKYAAETPGSTLRVPSNTPQVTHKKERDISCEKSGTSYEMCHWPDEPSLPFVDPVVSLEAKIKMEKEVLGLFLIDPFDEAWSSGTSCVFEDEPAIKKSLVGRIVKRR